MQQLAGLVLYAPCSVRKSDVYIFLKNKQMQMHFLVVLKIYGRSRFDSRQEQGPQFSPAATYPVGKGGKAASSLFLEVLRPRSKTHNTSIMDSILCTFICSIFTVLLFVSFNVGFYLRNLIRYAASSDGMIVSCKLIKHEKEEVVANFQVRIAWQYHETPQVNRS